MNEVKILESLMEKGTHTFLGILDTLGDENELYGFFDTVIENMKKSPSNQSSEELHRQLILMGYLLGVAVQKEKSPNPLVNYIKDNKMIFVEFEMDGKKGGILVPESWDNSQIKKEIQKYVGIHNGKWNGNFRKLSEFEQKKCMKEIEGLFNGKVEYMDVEIQE